MKSYETPCRVCGHEMYRYRTRDPKTHEYLCHDCAKWASFIFIDKMDGWKVVQSEKQSA